MVNLQVVRYLKNRALNALQRVLAEEPKFQKDIKGEALG